MYKERPQHRALIGSVFYYRAGHGKELQEGKNAKLS